MQLAQKKRRRESVNYYRKHGDGVVVTSILATGGAAGALAGAAIALGHEEREVLPFLALVGLPEEDVRPLHLLVAQLPLEEHGQGHAGPVYVGVHLHRKPRRRNSTPPIPPITPKDRAGRRIWGARQENAWRKGS